MKDFYYILGVDTNCSSIEIKEAYRKLSKKFHPDVNQNDKYFESRFREIHEAYVILNDSTQRAQYDRNLKKFKTQPSSGSSSSQQRQHRTHKPPPNTYYQARPAASYKVNPRRSIDVLFSIILIGVTIIFGDYVYKAMNSPVKSKPYTVAPAVVNAVASTATAKHHHHKHNFKNTALGETPKVSSEAAVVKPSVQPVKVAAPVVVPVPVPAKIVPPPPIKDYLYKSAIRGNLTGIVNMHESEKFSSPVIKEIPNDSEVQVLAKGSSYYKVRYDGEEGYVPRWTLQDK